MIPGRVLTVNIPEFLLGGTITRESENTQAQSWNASLPPTFSRQLYQQQRVVTQSKIAMHYDVQTIYSSNPT